SPKEIDFSSLRERANAKGALVFYLNRNSLEAKEREELVTSQADASKVEEELFAKSLQGLSGVSQEFKGSAGAEKSKLLLRVLKAEQSAGETRADFETRVLNDSKQVLDGGA
ncbi:hypothetical protein J4220_03915, partial [Candidatus Micrarchaeota archaeon]|nr:hypothetical protein [Candidatus Micrarchaeota archaeon]